MPFFSIIVPVYNVEDYLDECVQSVLTQTFTDFELILIDDGSSDNSPILCDYYSKTDSRIKVFHKENGGASSARNYGIENMSGEYVLFLDSDDFWNDSDMLNILHQTIIDNASDIVIFGCTDFNMVTGNSVISRTGYDSKYFKNNDYYEALHYLLSSKMIPGGPTIFTASADLIKQSQFCFKTDIQNEDFDFVLTVFLTANSTYAIDNPFYMYRQGRADSVTGASSIKMIEGIDYTLSKWIPIAEKLENKQIMADVLNYLAFIYTTGFVILGRLPKKDRAEALRIIRKHKSVMKYGYWRKTKVIRFADRLMGDRLFSKLSVIYYKHTHIGV